MMEIRIQSALFLTVATLVVLPGFATAQSSSKKPSYDKFAMVRTRNIFDPDRQANGPMTSSTTAASASPTTAADYAALTGTLVTADKVLAFFSGSRPEFNKVLPLHGDIAGATITAITSASIIVERAGKPITIAVGQTVPLDGTTAPMAAPILTINPAPAATEQANPSTNTSSSSKEAIMRRMMEKRQQELK
jgi:hypothetical protein